MEKYISNIEYYLDKIQLIIKNRNKIYNNNISMELENSNIGLIENRDNKYVLIDKPIQENDIKYTLSNVEYNINDLKKFIENEKLNTNNFQENFATFTTYFSNIIKKYNLEIDDLKHRVDYLESTTTNSNINIDNIKTKNLELPNKDPNNNFNIYNKNKSDYDRSCSSCLF